MGITIFAKGRIDRMEDIHDLIEVVKGVAEGHGWRYSVVEDSFNIEPDAALAEGHADKAAVVKGSLGLKGIVLYLDPKCESLSLLFGRSGTLTNAMQQLLSLSGDWHHEPFTSCKTQFGSIELHIAIVELLDLLKNRFVSNLVVTDESEYWETRDVRRLATKRSVLAHYMDHVAEVVSGIRLSEDVPPTAQAIGERIEQALLKAEEETVVH